MIDDPRRRFAYRSHERWWPSGVGGKQARGQVARSAANQRRRWIAGSRFGRLEQLDAADVVG
jgi:hypothetical protein